MNASIQPAQESWWKTYFKSACFIAPALLAWYFIAIFVFPKLQQIWVDAKMMDSEFQWMMGSLHRAFQNTTLVCFSVIALLLLFELGLSSWRRHRRVILGAFVFLLNTAIILGLTTSCIVAAIAGPALVRH